MSEREYLFGSHREWNPLDWTASDDSVRGGKSQSFLTVSPSGCTATFHGVLDIKTLGGAGFASQKTTGANRLWDLSAYDGIELVVAGADAKCYTLTVRDTILPKSDDGRDQASTSYECNFVVKDNARSCKSWTVFIAWEDFKPTYRGRDKPDAPKLNTKRIKRLSLLMRSFFGEQEGNFSLSLSSIAAVKGPKQSSLHTGGTSEGLAQRSHRPEVSSDGAEVEAKSKPGRGGIFSHLSEAEGQNPPRTARRGGHPIYHSTLFWAACGSLLGITVVVCLVSQRWTRSHYN